LRISAIHHNLVNVRTHGGQGSDLGKPYRSLKVGRAPKVPRCWPSALTAAARCTGGHVCVWLLAWLVYVPIGMGCLGPIGVTGE
jgi:hypothetical protein